MPDPNSANVVRPRARGYGLRINTRLFRLAAGPDRSLRVRSAPPQANRIQTSEAPEEFVDEFGQTFARSDFTGGEGLQYAHRRDNDTFDATRFWDSRNINTSKPDDGDENLLTLLPTTESVEAVTGVGRMAYDQTYLWVTDGTTLRRTADPLAGTPTFTTVDPHAGQAAVTVEDVAALGDDVYAALGTSGLHRDTGGGWAHWNDVAAVRCWAVKNRIVVSDGRSLYEVTASGAAPTALKTIDVGREFTAAVDGGSAILAGADDGYVYAFTPTGTAGALEIAAQDLFQDERITSLGYAQGLIFVGTSQPTAAGGAVGRLWRCQLASGGTLTDRQLVREWGTEVTSEWRGVEALHGSRDSVYAVVLSEDGSEVCVWRNDLRTGGVSRWFVVDAADVSYSTLEVSGRLFASVTGDGVFRESTSLASSGYLIGPLGDFYSASDKTWVAATLEADVGTGQRVRLQYSTDPSAITDPDHASWSDVVNDDGLPNDGEAVMTGVTSRYIVGKLVLTPDGSDGSPSVRSFGFRAYPADYDFIAEIPVNVSDRLERHNRRGKRVRRRGLAEYQALLGFEGVSATVELYDLGLVARGQIVQIDVPVRSVSERGSVTEFALATFRGRRLSLVSGGASGAMGGSRVGASMVGGEV